ncbi:MAG: hypothetical protein E7294_03195 [Lachnospiraceae bacterium]|jgi:hypothetical protein|nr:hypothetical protein [Lachnospiraceae bacterium]
MKQAFLITAYKDFDGLYALAEFLTQTAYVYIHMDAKSDITSAQIAKLNTLHNCHAIRKYKICWGGFAHVEAILELLTQAVENDEISYLHLLTGEDLPLCTMEELDAKYLRNEYIYMDAIPAKDFTPQVRKRVRYHNWFADKNVKNPFLWQLQNLTVNMQKLFGIRRDGIGEFKEDRLYKGLVYISMPKPAAEYVVHYCQEHTEFLEELKDCQIPEEFFFQTLLMNSSFAKKVAPKPVRYMNWEKGDGGSPAYLEIDDLPKIRQGDYDFARKFGHGISDALRRELFEGKKLP